MLPGSEGLNAKPAPVANGHHASALPVHHLPPHPWRLVLLATCCLAACDLLQQSSFCMQDMRRLTDPNGPPRLSHAIDHLLTRHLADSGGGKVHSSPAS